MPRVGLFLKECEVGKAHFLGTCTNLGQVSLILNSGHLYQVSGAEAGRLGAHVVFKHVEKTSLFCNF